MRRYAALVVGAGAALLFVRLGVWQLDRLSTRRASNEAIETQLEREPVALESATAITTPVDSLVHRRTSVEGVFDFSREVIVVARSQDGVPGVHVVTPLMLASGEAVLVERLWLPSPDAQTVNLDAAREPDSARVEGVFMRPAATHGMPWGEDWPRYVQAVGPSHLAELYPYRLIPLSIRRIDEVPVANAVRVRLPERNDGSHLSYAIQWFAFASIALVGSAILFRAQRREAAAIDIATDGSHTR